jgi:hypothetical protein
MKPPTFQRPNHHRTEPPSWVHDPPGRWFFFENANDEQWVASASQDRLLVTGGDIGWQTIDIQKPDYVGILAALWTPNTWFAYATSHPEWMDLNTSCLEERLWLASIIASCLHEMGAMSSFGAGPVR